MCGRNGVMWHNKRCIEVGVKLHKAIKANEPLGMGACQAPCYGVVHPLLKLNQKAHVWRRATGKRSFAHLASASTPYMGPR